MYSRCGPPCTGSVSGSREPFRILTTVTTTAAQVLGLVFTLIGSLNRTTVEVPDAPRVSHRPGAAGTPIGLTLVFNNRR